MPLSKRKKGEAKDEALPPASSTRTALAVSRGPGRRQTWSVDYVLLSKKITTVGFGSSTSASRSKSLPGSKAASTKLLVNETGQMVEKDEDLASLYSPDLVVTVQNLLDSKRNGNAQLLTNRQRPIDALGNRAKTRSRRYFRSARKPNTHVKIRSPIKGHVIKNVEKAVRGEGSPLYDVADLSTVWIEGQVYEEETSLSAAARALPQGSPRAGKRSGSHSSRPPHRWRVPTPLSIRTWSRTRARFRVRSS